MLPYHQYLRKDHFLGYYGRPERLSLESLARTPVLDPIPPQGSAPRCCGQSLRFAHTLPCSSFVRHVSGGSLVVRAEALRGGGGGADVSPPARILDFRLAGNVRAGERATFEWTATGDDQDLGTGRSTETPYIKSKKLFLIQF